MNNPENYIVECCPHCDTENEIRWDIETEGYEAYCPHCGKPMLICSECMSAEDNELQKCDWHECGKCFRCKQEVSRVSIYRKYDNEFLEKMWKELEDIPVDENECLDIDWQGWSKGTRREDIWHWFDEQHSKGVGWLMNEYEG